MLKNDFQGRRGERIPHMWLNTIANFWNKLRVTGGGYRRTEDGECEIIIPSSVLDNLLASFLIYDTDGTVCFMEPGTFYRNNNPVAIIGLPATIQCLDDTFTWIRFDTNAGTAQWQEGTSTPASSGTIEIYPVHAIASDGTNIGTIHHDHPANFHTHANEITVQWQDMGTTAEHADSAATDTWTSGTKGLKYVHSSDLGYDHTAGTPRLYLVKRCGTYDKLGHYLGESVESLVEVDVPISHALLGT